MGTGVGHLDGEHHAHEAGRQQRNAQRARPHQLQLLDRVAHVHLACACTTPLFQSKIPNPLRGFLLLHRTCHACALQMPATCTSGMPRHDQKLQKGGVRVDMAC